MEKNQIFYVSIIKSIQKKILVADFTLQKHNLHYMLNIIINNSKPNTRKSYIYEGVLRIDVVTEDNYIYLCIAHSDYPLEKSYHYLEEVKSFFLRIIVKSTVDRKNPSKELNEFMENRMVYYNDNKTLTKTDELYKNLVETKDIFIDDLAKLLEREEKLETLLEKTTKMRENFVESNTFRQQLLKKERDTNIKTVKIKLKKKRIIFISIFIFSYLIFLTVVYACQGYTFPECRI